MAKDYAAQPYAEVRRRDRAVADEAWIAEMVTAAPVGVLATVHDGQPFINSNIFAYDAERHCLYMHTAQVGRTRANVEADARVCFSVFSMGRLLPAEYALNMSVEYTGVVAFGRAGIVEDEAEARHGLQLLLDKYFAHLRPGEDYRAITDEELKRTAVYRIQIDAWSGKQKKVGDDFPGAFFYPPPQR